MVTVFVRYKNFLGNHSSAYPEYTDVARVRVARYTFYYAGVRRRTYSDVDNNRRYKINQAEPNTSKKIVFFFCLHTEKYAFLACFENYALKYIPVH